MYAIRSYYGFDSGLWVKDGHSFINIRKATPDARLHGVRIYQFDDKNELESVTDADDATFASAGSYNFV